MARINIKFWILITLPSLFLGGIGTYWAFSRGASDFELFYQVGHLVQTSRTSLIYFDTPDRFPYLPSLAIFFTPLSLISIQNALFFFCALKTLAIFFSIFIVARFTSPWIAVATFACFSKPILIDFLQGGLNSFLLLILILSIHSTGTLSHFVLGLISPVRLFLAPSFLFSGYKAKKNLIAWILGLFVFVIFPFIWLDTQTVLESFNHFRTVTFGRGIPISPHNQSFYAFSMRMLSGEAFQAPALQHTLSAYPAHLPVEYARGLSIFWSLLFLGAAAVSLFRIKNPILFFSFCLLASPFLWKSDTLYFLPLVLQLSSRPFFKRWLVILFCILQLLSLDIIGRQAVTLVESSSLLMWFFAMISWKELFRGAKLSR